MKNASLKALFWKECRENIRWAVLALLLLSLGLTYAMYRESFPQALHAIWGDANLVLTIGTPLVALALGMLQILPELRRDRWAFLVHRPASRTILFFGKVIPGVCLYLLATILPLLGFAAWAAQPSHVPAPFDFRFTLAGWAAVVSGLPFYFAGLLVALRPARWYGSRALPLLTAILAPLAANMFALFWPVVLVCLLISAVLLCTAWGTFVTSGEYKAQTKPARFALGLALYPACVGVGIGVLMLSFAAYNAVAHTGEDQEWWRNEQNIDTQGHVYEHDDHSDRQGHVTTTITDENGKLVAPRVWDKLGNSHKLMTPSYLYLGGFSQRYFRYSDPNSYVFDLTSSVDDASQKFWYYETAARQIVGYSVHQPIYYPASARFSSVLGYLGPNGFSKNRVQAGKFSDVKPGTTGFAGSHLLVFPNIIYCYILEASPPSLNVLQTLPGGSAGTTLLSQTEDGFVTNGGNEDTAQLLIVTAGTQMTVYSSLTAKRSKMPTRLFTVTVPADTKTYAEVQVSVLPNHSRFFFWYQSPNTAGADRLTTITSTGRIVSDRRLPAEHGLYKQPPARFAQAAPAIVLPPDGLCAAALYGCLGDRLHWDSASGLWNTMLQGAGPILFFSALGSLLPALLGWLISRRLGDCRGGQMSWALGVFWLGGYGVLLLLALRAWPARLTCPSCKRLRVVDRDECEHCRAGWPPPQRDGTEIFDTDIREAVER